MTADQRAAAPVVLFDFDGVLVRGDTFEQFLRERIHASRWRQALALAAAPVALPLLRTQRGLPAGARIFARISRAGSDPADYALHLREFSRRVARDPTHVIAAGFAALRQASATGARVAVISGNLETVVRDVLAEHGLEHIEVIASRLRPRRRYCIGATKLTALAEAGITPPWDIAYSDSIVDLPLLRHARRPVLVNATARLKAAVASRLGREPENVDWN